MQDHYFYYVNKCCGYVLFHYLFTGVEWTKIKFEITRLISTNKNNSID